MKSYLSFAWRVLIALVIINGILGIVGAFISSNIASTARAFISNPASLLSSSSNG